jgi:preprotein translocase SecE subunit
LFNKRETEEVAKNTRKQTKPAADENVVRIKAAPSKKSAKTEKVAPEATVVAEKVAQKVKKQRSDKGVRGLGALRAIGGYFKGAWVELRLVRWPNRRATWGLTGAVIAYSAFFVVFVLLLDAAFKYLFSLILGK